jgi:very-short-patch-repair endonuclease
MTPQRLPNKTHGHARELRHNPTDPESILWSRLRAHRLNGVHFRRQYAIGKFVVDFCAPKNRLIIEIDGSQHLDSADYDAERTATLQSKGYKVLRFWNQDVTHNLEAVLEEIERELGS